MTKRTNLIFLALFLPLFLQAQMQKGLFTMRPDIGIDKGEKNIAYYGGINYGEILNNNLLISGNIGVGKGGGGVSEYVGSFGAGAGVQYYYFKDSKFKPYLLANVGYSSLTFRLKTIVIGNNINTTTYPLIIDTLGKTITINQINASVGTGVQYFLNENLALDASFKYTAFAIDKNSKPLLQQEYRIRIQPFYSPKSYREANDVKDFFYRGRLAIGGGILFAPEKRKIVNDYSIFDIGAGTTYFFNKYFGVGGSFNLYTIGKNISVVSSLSTQSNIKLVKRLYLSPSVGVSYSHSKNIGNTTNLSANLGFSYFINKNIAWNLGFLSIPIYSTETKKSNFLYLSNSFSYYLK